MKGHILLVDNDAHLRRVFAAWLEYAGYRVTQAEDGETAIELLARDAFDVVLTDIVMRCIDGIEVLQTARQQKYRPEVIVITGYGSLETALAAFRKGAYDYLLKPCNNAELLACVERAVKRRAFELQLLDAAAHLFPAMAQQSSGLGQPLQMSAGHDQQTSRANDADTRNIYTPPSVHIGLLSIGRTRYEVFFNGQPVRLTPIEYAVLYYLAQHPGEICRCCDIVQYTHGLETSNADAQALVRPHVYNLRKKIAPVYLATRRGVGYMLVNPDQEAEP